MKGITSKSFTQKIVIGILIVLSFNFITPTFSHAGLGGMLAGSFIELLAAIPDAIIGGLQFFMLDGNMGVEGEILQGYMVGSSKYSADKYPGTEFDSSKISPIKIKKSNLEPGLLDWIDGNDYAIPIVKFSPEKIFSGKVPALDANFISPKTYKQTSNITADEADAMNKKSITQALQVTISSWYKALRNLAVVGLLSVLLYVGIRMILTSAASDKAKYKQMFFDWAIALCLVFFLHYIMSFTLTVTEEIVKGIGGDYGIPVQVVKDGGDVDQEFNTDLMGIIRLNLQYDSLGMKFIYLAMYIAMVVYTVKFTWTYIKRAITMAFLTLIAPMVALTYPIDKIGDGKAQAFNFWLKEYIFNALLQPFHLILYTIFVGSAIELTANNPIYAIMFLAFIGPAEKILRKMFGFEKSSTAGSAFAGGAAGAAAFNLLNKGVKSLAKGKGGSSGGNGKIRTADKNNGTAVDNNAVGDDLSAFGPGNVRQDTALSEANAAENDNWDNNDLYLSGQNRNLQNSVNPQAIPANEQVSEKPDGIRGKISDLQKSASAFMANGPQWYNNMEDGLGKKALGVGGRTIRGALHTAGKPFTYTGSAIRKNLGTPEGRRNALKQSARFAGRMAVRGAAAATVGAVGLGMGIAGDDLEDVLKYGAGGAVLGASAGGALADGIDTVGSTFSEGYYGDANIADVNKRYDEVFLDNEKREYFGEEFGVKGKELDNVMRQVAFFDTQGIKDDKQIKQTIKQENKIAEQLNSQISKDISNEEATAQREANQQLARAQAATITKIANSKELDEKKLATNAKYQEEWKEKFKAGLEKTGLNKNDLNKQSDHMLNLLLENKKVDRLIK